MKDCEKLGTVILLIMSLAILIFAILDIDKDFKFDTILFGSYTVFSLIRDLIRN